MFQQTLSEPFLLPNETTINSLLYADDLIIQYFHDQNQVYKTV
jgi:hypothetical protein